MGALEEDEGNGKTLEQISQKHCRIGRQFKDRQKPEVRNMFHFPMQI